MYKKSMELKIFDEYFFIIGTVILFIISLYDNPVREIPFNWIIISFLLLCLFNIFCHSLIPIKESLSIIKPNTIKYLRLIFLFIFCITLLIRYCNNIELIQTSIIFAVILNLIAFDLQKFGYSPIIDTPETHPGALMGNLPRLGIYITIIAPYIFKYSIPLYIVCVITLLFGVSDFPQISILPITFLLLLFNFKNKITKIIFSILSILAVLYLLSISKFHIISSLTNRLQLWKDILIIFFQNPLSGFGLGYIESTVKELNKDATLNSSYIQIIIEGGILFVIWLYLTTKKFISKFDYSYEALALLSLILISLVDYPFEIKRLWFTIIFIISAFIIKQLDKEFIYGTRA
jgi:hypothetical protein